MMISIASIKRAAASLEAEQKAVTAVAIARRIDAPWYMVTSIVNRIAGLKESIGLTSGSARTGDEYRVLIDRMLKAGVVVTVERLAMLTQKRPRTVRAWLASHRDEYPTGMLVGRLAFQRRKLVQRLRWLVRTRDPKTISITAAARLVGSAREYLYEVFRDMPGFREELGI